MDSAATSCFSCFQAVDVRRADVTALGYRCDACTAKSRLVDHKEGAELLENYNVYQLRRMYRNSLGRSLVALLVAASIVMWLALQGFGSGHALDYVILGLLPDALNWRFWLFAFSVGFALFEARLAFKYFKAMKAKPPADPTADEHVWS